MNNQKIAAGSPIEKYWFSIILILVLISYGQFWNRGGYGDDFAFLGYVTPQTFWDSVIRWAETFNSRITQALLMPLLMKGLAGETPEMFQWGSFHLIGIFTFCVTLYSIDRVFRLFSVQWPIRMVICLIFALNPIKNEALLWPAAIVGYIIPICLFCVACWLYVSSLKHSAALRLTKIFAFLLVLVAIFAIEQLVPVFLVLLALRFTFLPSSKYQRISELFLTTVIVALFVVTTFFGKTTDRAAPFLSFDITSIAGRFWSVSFKSIKDTLGYGLSVLLDPFYSGDLVAAALSIGFLVAVLILVALCWFLIRNSTVFSFDLSQKQILGLCGTGVCIWLASLSPFIILSYYLPPRTLYIPSFGLALIGGTILLAIIQKIDVAWVRVPLILGTVVLCAIFVLVNLYAQRDFAVYWNNERKIINYVSSIADDIPASTDVSIFNIPVGYGPSPGFVNNFSMNGVVNWFSPGRHLSGSTRNDLSDIIDWKSDLTEARNVSLSVKEGFWFLLWTKEGVLRASKLVLLTDENQINCSKLVMKRDVVPLQFAVHRLQQQSVFEQQVILRVGGYFRSPCLNLGVLEVFVDIPDGVKARPKLYLHAVHANGTKLPYDLPVNKINGFRETGQGYRKYIFIQDFSSISSVELSLSGLKPSLNATTQDDGTSKQTDESKRQAAWPRIKFF